MKAKVSPQLPKGFKAISGGGGGDTVEWKKGVIVTGNVIEIKSIETPVRKPKKGEPKTKISRLMRVKTKEGKEVAVWEKAALKGLFDEAKKGKAVYIEHIGMGKAQPGQSAPNLFVAGIK